MDYEEKYSKSIELDVANLDPSDRFILDVILKEGELRYRDWLSEQLLEIAKLSETVEVKKVIELVRTERDSGQA